MDKDHVLSLILNSEGEYICDLLIWTVFISIWVSGPSAKPSLQARPHFFDLLDYVTCRPEKFSSQKKKVFGDPVVRNINYRQLRWLLKHCNFLD